MSVLVANGDGYGFNVTTDWGKPLVLFAYETHEAAEAAARQVEAAIEQAVLVRPAREVMPIRILGELGRPSALMP